MRKVIIIYPNLFDRKGENLLIGGVETYLLHLSEVIAASGCKAIVVQAAKDSFRKTYKNLEVYGVKIKKDIKIKSMSRSLVKFVESIISEDEDIVIFGSDYIYSAVDFKRTLVIQHGIAWDLPLTNNSLIQLIKSKIKLLLILYRSYRVENFVCVDYNFVNFCRSFFNIDNKKVWIIPNCSLQRNNNIETTKSSEVIDIIFARRFIWYRGTRLFADAIKRILTKYPNVKVTFAGEGPDEEHLQHLFSENKNVTFTKYDAFNSVQFHSKYHIAVVPSLGSEGTSLSLAEAMSAGCAVIASNVGGMTNMIINGYNGILINPNVNEFVEALSSVIDDKDYRERLSLNAIKTSEESFNCEKWNNNWNEIIRYMTNV